MKFPRLTPEEALVLSPGYNGENAKELPAELRGLAGPAKAKMAGLIGEYEKTESFHAYFLCSLRSLEDFRKAEAMAQAIEASASTVIPDFRLVHVGGLAVPADYCEETDPNEAKGLFERKMLQRSLSGFMDMGSTETWGKITEAVMLRLFHNRPVVIYTNDAWLYPMLRDIHPLKIVGSPWQGLGFHVVNDLVQAVACLVREITDHVRTEKREMRHGVNEYCTECGSLLRMERPCTEPR